MGPNMLPPSLADELTGPPVLHVVKNNLPDIMFGVKNWLLVVRIFRFNRNSHGRAG
jgi:hypothetical protein